LKNSVASYIIFFFDKNSHRFIGRIIAWHFSLCYLFSLPSITRSLPRTPIVQESLCQKVNLHRPTGWSRSNGSIEEKKTEGMILCTGRWTADGGWVGLYLFLFELPLCFWTYITCRTEKDPHVRFFWFVRASKFVFRLPHSRYGFSAEISARKFYSENTDPSIPCLPFDFEPLPLLYGLNRAIWRSGGSDQ
jgi:hypothetical protein